MNNQNELIPKNENNIDETEFHFTGVRIVEIILDEDEKEEPEMINDFDKTDYFKTFSLTGHVDISYFYDQKYKIKEYKRYD
jgi:hypothetical protein